MKKSVNSILIAVFAVACILVSCKEDTVLVTGVKITTDVAKLYAVDATKQLTATIFPDDATNQSVGWKSSNEAVASVNPDGLVTAKGAGRCVVTVTTDDGGIQSNCVVEVDLDVYVTGISLNKSTLTLEGPLGTKETLIATLAPPNSDNKMYSWSTSNPVVAQVDEDGEVISISPGKCTITVTTEYTTGGGEHSATCEVTVLVPYETISINKSQAYLLPNASETLTITYVPAYATNKEMEWSSSDPGIVTVDENGKITAVKGGNVTITAISKDTGDELTCEVGVLAPGFMYEVTFENSNLNGFTGTINNGNGTNALPAYGANGDLQIANTVDGTPALWLNFVFPSSVGRQWATYNINFPASLVPIVAVATRLEFDFWFSKNTLDGSGGEFNYGTFQWDLIPGNSRLKPNPNHGETKPEFLINNSELIDDYYKYSLNVNLDNGDEFVNGNPYNKAGLTNSFSFQFGHWGVWVLDPVYLSRIKIVVE